MGRDWYHFDSFAGIGFTVYEQEYEVYKDSLGQKYCCLIYSEHDGTHLISRLFIYDKKTVIYDNIKAPGPYEIKIEDHSTELFRKSCRQYFS